MIKEFKNFYDNNIINNNTNNNNNNSLNNNNNNKDIDIVCVGSVLGIIGSIGYTCYSPTKYALKGLLDSLLFEFEKTNIKLHYYAPSNIDTPGLKIENENKPYLVKQMENIVKTSTGDEAAHFLLCNMEKYLITSEPDLEILKNGTSYMNKHNLIDIFMSFFSAVAVSYTRYGIVNNIRFYMEKNEKEKMDEKKNN